MTEDKLLDRIITVMQNDHYAAPTLLAGLIMTGLLKEMGYRCVEHFMQHNRIDPRVGHQASRIVFENTGTGQTPRRTDYPPLQVQMAVTLGFLPAEPDGEAPSVQMKR